MGFPRFSDLPTALKIGIAPGFAVVMMAGIAAGALWTQQNSSAVLSGVMTQGQWQLRLAADSGAIKAANGALYAALTGQAAGGSADASAATVTAVLSQLDAVKTDLVSLRATLPASQRPAVGAVLKELALYRGGVTVVGSMLGIDFKSAASFLAPFQTNYASMTATLAAASARITAPSHAGRRRAHAGRRGRGLLADRGADRPHHFQHCRRH